MPERYTEAPTEWDGDGPSIFLAGGITDCPDWQAEARARIGSFLFPRCMVLNPRRENFPIDDPNAAEAQIAWEFRHLHRADVILFWFTAGPSPQPIVLYELGRHAALDRPIAVGVDPGYIRAADVHFQLAHARPDVPVFERLSQVCGRAVALAISL